MDVCLCLKAIVQAKPLNSPIDDSINEVDHDNVNLQKDSYRSEEQARNSALPTNEELIATIRPDATNSAAGTVLDKTVRPVSAI